MAQRYAPAIIACLCILEFYKLYSFGGPTSQACPVDPTDGVKCGMIESTGLLLHAKFHSHRCSVVHAGRKPEILPPRSKLNLNAGV